MDVLVKLANSLLETISMIATYLVQIVSFFIDLFKFIPLLITFIPSPFREITLLFLPIYIALFFYKLYKM